MTMSKEEKRIKELEEENERLRYKIRTTRPHRDGSFLRMG